MEAKKLKKSSNYSKEQRGSLSRMLLFTVIMWLGAVAISASSEEPAIVMYIANHQIKELSGCIWTPERCFSPRDGDYRYVNPQGFFADLPEAFKRWTALWPGTAPGSYYSQKYWEIDIKPGREYMVYFPPGMPDYYSAVLLERRRGKLIRAYKIRPDGREIEYRPLSERPGPVPRDLVRISSEEINRLTGCAWGEECDWLEINNFFYGYRSQPRSDRDIFRRWSDMYTPAAPWKPREHESYSWTYNGHTYNLSHPESSGLESNLYATALMETKSDRLVGAYRIRKDGSEIEYRPFFAVPELQLPQYRSVKHKRAPKSNAFDDLTEVQHIYLSAAKLHEQFGVSWGDPFSSVKRSRLTKSMVLQTLDLLLLKWHMPTWASMAEDSAQKETRTKRSWLYDGYRYYLFANSSKTKVVVLQFVSSEPEALEKIFEYRSGGEVRIIHSTEERVRREHEPPVYLYQHGGGPKQVQWRELQREHGLQVPEEIRCRHERPLVQDDPASFFEARGRAFSFWRQQIEQLQKQGRYSYRSDKSWIGPGGQYFYLLRDACWEAELLCDGNPHWQVWEYEADKLIRVYDYDSLWREAVFRELPYLGVAGVLGEPIETVLYRAKDDKGALGDLGEVLEVNKESIHPTELEEAKKRLNTVEWVLEARNHTELQSSEESDSLSKRERLMASIAVLSLLLVLFLLILRRELIARRVLKARAQGKRMGLDV